MGHLSLEKIGKCMKMCQTLPLELQGPLASGTPQASCCEQNQSKSVLKCRCEDWIVFAKCVFAQICAFKIFPAILETPCVPLHSSAVEPPASARLANE